MAFCDLSVSKRLKALPVRAIEYSSGGCYHGKSSRLTISFTDSSSSALDYSNLSWCELKWLWPGL